jgi:uncharacterized protein YqjF (DUF2071 family)
MSQVGPTNSEASAGAFLRARWVNLAMVNYEIEPDLLTRYVPAGTELDNWNGKTFVSMVGFLFEKTSVLGMPALFHRNFEEVNLRFYVRRETPEGWRRGVVFIKEIVPKRLIAWIARTVYNEAYVALPTRRTVQLPGADEVGIFRYEWLSEARWNSLEVQVRGEPALAEQDSEETFISEHYWGYCRQRDGGTVEYQVEHPHWRVWRGIASKFECDVARFYGAEFAKALGSPASSAFVADGSAVIVRKGRRLKV